MKRAITILASAVALLVGCDKSGDGLESAADGVARFSSDISTRVSTDLSDNSSAWESGDEIGIYMSGTASSSNVQYVAQKSATTTDFAVAEGAEGITYPNSGTVDFVAYSPYSAEVVSEQITIDLSDQSSVAQRNLCDFMVSTEVTGKSYATSSESIALSFDHKLAIVKFSVTCGDTVETLSGLTCEVSGLASTQSYNVLTGAATGTATTGTIKMLCEVSADGETATLSAIVHPENLTGSVIGLTFSLGSTSYSTSILGREFVVGMVYEYRTTIGDEYVTFADSCTINDWTGDEGFTGGSIVSSDTTLDLVYNDGVFEIYTATGLYAFADLVNGGNRTYTGVSGVSVYFGDSEIAFGTTKQLSISGKLMANVNLAGNDSNQWTRIGDGGGNYTGVFDGGGHKISGLYIDNSTSYSSSALFYIVGSGGVIKNLGVEGSIYDQYCGGIACQVSEGGSVINCYNEVALTANYNNGVVRAGGIVDENSGTVANCYNIAAVSGTASSFTYVGGVVAINCGTITNCYNIGAVSGNDSSNYAGTVLGANINTGATIDYFYWANNVTGSVTNGYGANDQGSIGTNYGDYTLLEMQAESFKNTLNTQVSDEMCLWAWDAGVNGGYPTLDFGNYAE
ncbi:MAG: fimbrillin family protein [Rikenellaceae bacterium]